MKFKDAQYPLCCMWDSSRMGPGGSRREACSRDNQIGRCRLSASSIYIPGKRGSQVGPQQG